MEGPESAKLLGTAEDVFVNTYARPPFVLDHGEGCWLYDTDGNQYLDMVAGIAVNALGYGDPAVVAALSDQAQKLWHTSNLFFSAPPIRLAERLVASCFADRVFFCNSGSEANEGAFKFARKWALANYGPSKTGFLAFSNAFHGRTFGALAATPREKYQAAYRPLMPGVRFGEFNDLAATAAAMSDDLCAVIVEPLQGEGGIYPADPEFLSGLRELCDKHHALLIFDEVQCGVGRTGTLWAHQAYGVEPDIMTAAKPLAGGLPMGAILCTNAVAGVFHPGDHGSTFAGGPLVAAVAEVVFDRISQPEFLAAVCEKGEYLKAKLAGLKSPHIQAIRGRGLIIGMDLDIPASEVVSAGLRHGLLLVNAGPQILRLIPPLVISMSELDLAVMRLGDVFAELDQVTR
jgi:acetylornithine/N-succinyldiaminopimelate aminotransferase